MPYLTNQSANDVSIEDSAKAFQEYQKYLETIRASLPRAAYEFASASWHYDVRHHKCLHDAWIDSIQVIEPRKGERQEIRSIAIVIKLLGAYHDGHIEIYYPDVNRYSLESQENRKNDTGHGDWIIDEVMQEDPSFVIHIVEFESGRVFIEAKDIIYKWIPMINVGNSDSVE